jgi:Ca2+-binding RTX toxin-like protein
MRRAVLFVSVLACLAAPAPVQATTFVTQPLDAYVAVPVAGTAGADVLRLTSSSGSVRIEDAAGVTVAPGAYCAQNGPTVAECSTWGSVDARLGGGADRVRLDTGWYGGSAKISGEAGNDVVDSGAQWVRVEGGSGTDTLSFASYDGWNLSVSTSTGDVQGVEVLEGSRQNDSLYGSSANETIRGGEGDDYLDAKGGVDTIEGGGGDDDIYAVDSRPDRVDCGDGHDIAGIDAVDTRAGGCETWSGPGVAAPPSMTPPTVFSPPPSAAPAPRPKPAPHVVRPARGKRGVISVLSRPAADAARTRIGARVGAPGAGVKVRMSIRHGDRRIGQTELVAGRAGEVVVNVPLDAELKRAVAQTRHVELTALIELEYQGASGLAEEYQATVVEPPPFVRGAPGVKRRGGFGVQRLTGTRRGDTLRGDSGDDTLHGRTGNDQLDGGTGNDRLDGSAGNDLLDGFDGDDKLLGGAGDDLIIESRFGDDTLSGGAGNDWIVGARGTDHISGGTGDDVIFGGSGSDTIDCGAGNDTVFVNLEIERRTARGCEKILDEDDIPSIPCPDEGTADGETMLGSDDADVCKGNAGNDDVEGAGGSDKLFGGDGADRIFGRFGDDQMFGEAGDDELEGGRGDDRLSGGAGNDQLNGGYGRDRVEGGPGNDTVVARGGGSDQVDCGPGRDVVIADRTDRLSGCETVRRK